VLGILLGPMVDENLRRGLILSNGNPLPFFQGTISIVLVVAVFLTLFGRSRPMKFAAGGIGRAVRAVLPFGRPGSRN